MGIDNDESENPLIVEDDTYYYKFLYEEKSRHVILCGLINATQIAIILFLFFFVNPFWVIILISVFMLIIICFLISVCRETHKNFMSAEFKLEMKRKEAQEKEKEEKAHALEQIVINAIKKERRQEE